MTTQERILDSAVSLFSRKGYKNTSIKEVAQGAGVNSLTVFRNFHDKDTLFSQAVQEMKKSTFEPEKLNRQLTFQNLEDDLLTIGKAYLDEIFVSLPLISVYIGDAAYFDQRKEKTWFISPVLKAHFQAYVEALDAASSLAKQYSGLLADLFVSYITRKAMGFSKYEESWEKTDGIEEEFLRDLTPQVHCIIQMIT